MKESHKFAYIIATSSFVCLYVILITFLPIDKEQQRFADTALGFLLGTVLGGGISYLLGGSATTKHETNHPKTNMNQQVFWEIQSLDDLIDGTSDPVKTLKDTDPNYDILLDDTNVAVLVVTTASPVTLHLVGASGSYDVTSSVTEFYGGRPRRPN